jgi:aminoglycoside/choline kinase family phosphotransferase
MRTLTHFLKQRLYPVSGYQGRLRIRTLQGDGSDRKVYRLWAGPETFIAVAHPKGRRGTPSENDSFYLIGQHLLNKGLPAPRIYAYDGRRGFFLLEDFGDRSLESVIRSTTPPDAAITLYRQVIDLLLKIQMEAGPGFETAWCYDTPRFDGFFSWERESQYFLQSFLRDYRGMGPLTGLIKREFRTIAAQVNREKLEVLLYRDFQSRNLMVGPFGFGLIDFQGARLGPPQYDLASLLIDPYVALSPALQENLLGYYLDRLSAHLSLDRSAFLENYEYIAFQRNVQILGAFSFLSLHKGKKYFETYIPAALAGLKRRVTGPAFAPYQRVRQVIDNL